MIEDIKYHLKNNPNDIIKILEYYKFKNIKKNGNEIRCAKPNGDNASTIRIKINDKLSASDFSTAYCGDLFGVIAHVCNSEFWDVLSVVECILGDIEVEEKEESLFGGILDEDIYEEEKEVGIKTYDESILTDYEIGWNKRFVEDNIPPSIQLKFEIGYDKNSNRITIPWRTINGEIVGVMGRLNSDNYGNYKYLPLIRFEKHLNLYGIYQNKELIQKEETVYLFESEKSVMQSYNWKIPAVSLGGNSVSPQQLDMLLSLGVKKIILAYDEGLEMEVIKRNINTIKNNITMMNDVKIGCMIDMKNEVLPKGSKCSPTDLGKDKFMYLKEHCIRRCK